MTRSTTLAAILVGLTGLLVLAGTGDTQPVSGDLILADARSASQGQVLGYCPTTRVLTTLSTGFAGYFPNWIAVDADNQALLVPFVDGQTYLSGFLARIYANGSLHLLKLTATDIGFSNSQVPAGDGTDIHAGNQGVLFRFDPTTLALTTLGLVPPALNAVGMDRDRGTILCLIFPPSPATGPGSILGFDPVSAAFTTLVAASTAISRPSAVVQDPATGDHVIARFDQPALVRMNPVTFAVTTLWPSTGANALTLTPRNTFLVATETDVREIDGQGTVLKTHTFPSILRLTGVAEYGSRRVALSGAAIPGSTVAIHLQSDQASDAGKSYVLAMSLATRPSVGGTFPNGEVLNLAPDTLFLVTVQNVLPHIFVGFQGVLDAQASAQAAVHLPAALPGGQNLPLHVGGVVVDPAAPAGISTVFSSVTTVLR